MLVLVRDNASLCCILEFRDWVGLAGESWDILSTSPYKSGISWISLQLYISDVFLFNVSNTITVVCLCVICLMTQLSLFLNDPSFLNDPTMRILNIYIERTSYRYMHKTGLIIPSDHSTYRNKCFLQHKLKVLSPDLDLLFIDPSPVEATSSQEELVALRSPSAHPDCEI